VTLGPVADELKPDVIEAVVLTVTEPLDTYKFLANGYVIPTVGYVLLDGAANAPPAEPVKNVLLVGNMSPLNLATLTPILNVVELL
jgi:hypothetical protein